MTEFGRELLAYILLYWFQAGTVSGILCTSIIARKNLKGQGYLTLGEILFGVVLMGIYIASGWLSLILLGILLEKHFKELFQIKIFQTTEYKTKNLLYKGEDEED